MKWSRQGGASVCLPFNLAIEKVIRDSRIHTIGTIFTFSNDIDIMERSEEDIKQSLVVVIPNLGYELGHLGAREKKN